MTKTTFGGTLILLIVCFSTFAFSLDALKTKFSLTEEMILLKKRIENLDNIERSQFRGDGQVVSIRFRTAKGCLHQAKIYLELRNESETRRYIRCVNTLKSKAPLSYRDRFVKPDRQQENETQHASLMTKVIGQTR